MEFTKSEVFTGFVCRNCGKMFPLPEHESATHFASFAEIIAAVKLHRCPSAPDPAMSVLHGEAG
jgi:hypothetical protein